MGFSNFCQWNGKETIVEQVLGNHCEGETSIFETMVNPSRGKRLLIFLQFSREMCPQFPIVFKRNELTHVKVEASLFEMSSNGLLYDLSLQSYIGTNYSQSFIVIYNCVHFTVHFA